MPSIHSAQRAFPPPPSSPPIPFLMYGLHVARLLLTGNGRNSPEPQVPPPARPYIPHPPPPVPASRPSHLPFPTPIPPSHPTSRSYRVIGPARICKRGDTLVAHLFPGARLELLDRDGNATALLLQHQQQAAVQPQPLTATDVTAALPVSYGSGSSTAVGSMGSAAAGSGDSAWSAGASLFSITDDEDVPPPLPAAAAPALAPMDSSLAAAATAAAPPALAAPPLMISGVGGGIGGSSAGGGAFPAAAGSAQAEAEAQLVVEECVLVAAHVELGGSASSVDLVGVCAGVCVCVCGCGCVGVCVPSSVPPAHAFILTPIPTCTTPTPTPLPAAPRTPQPAPRTSASHTTNTFFPPQVDVGLQPALHRLNGHIYLSVRCLPPCAQFELGPNAHLCHPISMTPPADTCC